MRKIILFILAITFAVALSAQEYHFKEGFLNLADMTSKGWTRNCGASSTASFIRGEYGGTYVPKFDATSNGTAADLISPVVAGAGKLTFWLYTNSTANRLNIHVATVINNVTQEVKLIPYTDISKTWTMFEVDLNIPATTNLKLTFWAELSETASASVVIDDIALTKYGSGGEDPEPEKRSAYDRVATDFGDGTWGDIADKLPSSGEYPTDTINEFILNKAVVYKGSTTDTAGEKHTNSIRLDKKSAGGNLELPWLKTIGQLEIHAAVGTAGNTFVVEEYDNNVWNTLETFTAIKTDSTFYLTIERDDTTRLRIANNSGGAVVIWKVQSRSLNDIKDLNVFSTVPAQNTVCFYNLTKEISVNFNHEVVAGSGVLKLNDTDIPLASCIIEGKNVTIPVTLESNPGSNKSYTLIIPEGTFVEKNNTSNLSKAYTLNFETLCKPAMPAGYNEMIDINYSDASAEMCRMDVYYNSTATEPTPIVINMHGGGWNHGAKEEQTGFGTFTSMGFAVANVEYRMTPQAKAPAAVEDVRCALQYILNNAATFNIDTEKIVFQGGSAGGHLALTAAYLQNNRLYDTNCNDYQGEIKILAVIDKYGPAKLSEFMFYRSLVEWLGDKSEDNDFISSISPADMVDANTPPTYIVHGDADPTVPYDQSVTLAAVLEANNVDYEFTTIPGGGHGGFASQYNTQISEEITTFLTRLLDSTNPVDNSTKEELFKPVVIDNTIHFNSKENGFFQVYDAQGKKVGETTASSFTLTATGVFIIKATVGNQTHVVKIVK